MYKIYQLLQNKTKKHENLGEQTWILSEPTQKHLARPPSSDQTVPEPIYSCLRQILQKETFFKNNDTSAVPTSDGDSHDVVDFLHIQQLLCGW